MASKRCGIVLVLVELTSFVGAQEFSQTSSNANDVLGWNGAQVDQQMVFPGPLAEPWVPREVIAATLERMCRYCFLVYHLGAIHLQTEIAIHRLSISSQFTG